MVKIMSSEVILGLNLGSSIHTFCLSFLLFKVGPPVEAGEFSSKQAVQRILGEIIYIMALDTMPTSWWALHVSHYQLSGLLLVVLMLDEVIR